MNKRAKKPFFSSWGLGSAISDCEAVLSFSAFASDESFEVACLEASAWASATCCTASCCASASTVASLFEVSTALSF